jgi:ABC-type nitrate/sulfonate/bicarbonate transport system permease component
MTLIVGAAALLAAGAGVTLILGWSTDDATLVWVSMIASGLAALLLYAASRAPDRSDGREDGS